MKTINKTVSALLLTAAVLTSATVVFAGNYNDQMNGKDSKLMAAEMQGHAQTLREAALALKETNPALSQRLSDMADMKDDILKNYEKTGMMNGNSEMPDMNSTGNKATKLGTQQNNRNVNTP